MIETQEPIVAFDASHPPQTARRRPGRVANVSPNLIPLLRDVAVPTTDHTERQQNDLAPAIGIAISTLTSAPIWALIFWVAWRPILLMMATS